MGQNNHNNSILLVEGSDMCGKTFICELIKEMVEVDKSVDETTYKYFKFPRYDNTFGNDILKHLKTFDSNSKNVFEEREIISNKLVINKIDSLKEIVNEIKENPKTLAVFDRFTMSQLIYDLAWLSNIKFRKHVHDVKDFFNIKNKYAAIVYNAYKNMLPDTSFKTIYCKKSVYLKCLSIVKDFSRRIDSYDKNKMYQQTVNALFENVYERKETYISFHNSRDKIADTIFELFDLIHGYNECIGGYVGFENLEKYAAVINTDEVYANIYKEMGFESLANAIIAGDEETIIKFIDRASSEEVDYVKVAKQKYVEDIKEFIKSVLSDKE